jgi:arylformamidase
MTEPRPPIWHGLTPEEHEYQYNPQAAVPDFAASRARREPWNQRAAATLNAVRDITYAEGALRTLDIYPAAFSGAPVHVFFHGGYWRAQDKANFAFVAEPLVRHGITAVILNYPLCPAVTLDAAVAAARDAVDWIARHIAEYGGAPGQITLSGHSAGAHLIAAVLAEDWPARGLSPDLVKSAIMISGIYDPAPAIATTVNAQIQLTPALAARHDYERIPPRLVRCQPWILAGAREPWQWIDQSFRYAHHLHRHGMDPGVLVCPGFHHFDILDQYGNETSPLMQLLLQETISQ